MGTFILTAGMDGRITQWDSRLLQTPLQHKDLYLMQESNNLIQMESSPIGFMYDSTLDSKLLVYTSEGLIYDLKIGMNDFQ